MNEKTVSSPSPPDRRSGADRRHQRRRGQDRFAADGWRYSGEPNRRSGCDRRNHEDRRAKPCEDERL